MRAGADDAEILAKAYLEPLASGIGGGLNVGWTTSPSAHSTWGFSIQTHVTLAFIPETGQKFDISQLPLDNIRVAQSSNTTISPTIGGINETGPEVIVFESGNEVADFKLPQGAGIHFVPAPMIQASVGIVKKTGIIIRFVPQIEVGDFGRFQMFGIGLKHEVSQWIPAGSFIPVDISVMFGYSNIDISAPLDLDPQPTAIPDPDYAGSYDNQKATTSFDTFTGKIIIGKSFPFINVYGAVGYETSTMTVALIGDYPVPVSGAGGKTQTTTVIDPFKYSQKGENTFSFTGGLTFKLAFFNIFGQYTFAKYPVVNAGVGFSFR